MLSRFVIDFLPRSKPLLISWLQSPSGEILEPQNTKSFTIFIVASFIAMKWWDWMPWSSLFECWILSQFFHSPLSLSCIGDGNGNPPQCSCLENLRDGGAWWAAVYGVTQSQTRLKQLSRVLRKEGYTCELDCGYNVRVGLWRKLSAAELMLLNCGVGEDSWESLGLQGDSTSPF